MASAAADIHERTKLSVRQHFGEASAAELERLVMMQDGGEGVPQHYKSLKTFGEVLPQAAVFIVAGVLCVPQAAHASHADSHLLPTCANAAATVKAFTSLPRWTAKGASVFGERLLQVQEADFKLLAAPGGDDIAAVRFLGEALRKNMSASEVARVLQEEAEGQRLIRTFHTSPTLGAVVMFASWSVSDWLDDVWDWLKDAAQWVVDAVNQFGEWACKQAKAVVDSVFSKYPNGTHIVENIPVLGLLVAGIYAVASSWDQAKAAFAINVNASVTLFGAGVGFLLGAGAGAMVGAALGKALGLLLQHAIAQAINDPDLRAKTGDISATRFIVEVALSGAVYGAAGSVAAALASELGMSCIKSLATSIGLTTLLSRLPEYFTMKALEGA